MESTSFLCDGGDEFSSQRFISRKYYNPCKASKRDKSHSGGKQNVKTVHHTLFIDHADLSLYPSSCRIYSTSGNSSTCILYCGICPDSYCNSAHYWGDRATCTNHRCRLSRRAGAPCRDRSTSHRGSGRYL